MRVRQIGFHVGCFFVVYCIYLFISKLPSACPGFGGKLSHGRGWSESFPRNEVVVFRLYLYQMNPVLIHHSCPLDDAWCGDLWDCLGNFHNLPVRILHDCRHRMSQDPDIENFRFQLLVIRCIHNVAVPYRPNIPSLGTLGTLLELAVVVFCWLQ